MSEKINISEKGASNVKAESTILYRPNIIDMENARVMSSREGGWNDFEIIGSSKKDEGEYRHPATDDPKIESIIRRTRSMLIGKKVQALFH